MHGELTRERLEAVGVDDEVDRRRAGLVGKTLEQEVLDPDAGVVELGLMPGRDDERRPARPAPRPRTPSFAEKPAAARERFSAGERAQLGRRHASHREAPSRPLRRGSRAPERAHSSKAGRASTSPCPAGSAGLA